MTTTTPEIGERWKADVAKYLDALADDVRAKAAKIERLEASIAKLTDAAEDVLTDAENECRESVALKNLRFAVLDAPAVKTEEDPF